MTVTVVGVDIRDDRAVPPDLGEVALVVGAPELVAGHAPAGARTATGAIESTMDDIAAAVAAGEEVVVLVHGDPGHFGVLRALRAKGLPVAVRPAVSDVQRMAAMLRRPWDDIAVVDARGREFRHAVNVCRARRAVAVLTAPGAGPAELARELSGWRRNLAVLEGLRTPDERLSIVDVTEAERRTWREPNLVMCLVSLDAAGTDHWLAGGPAAPPPDGWALDESAFATRAGVGIAPEVRALALARLAPRAGTLLWDVCAGSGAIGIEAARLGAAVVAVERDSGLCVRIVANAGAHGVDVRLVDGDPLTAIPVLPRPHAVFVGAAHPEVVRACAGVGAERIVVLVPEADRLGRIRAALRDAGYAVDGCQLSAAPLVDLPGEATGVGPAGSTFLVWGARR
ncbi:bifunctional cobalt-precorrin-7 (C(5))-methyltransferase/cobalt-precorrin-6B (C(15))-methyltransferase [Actinokineospora enzanensis]|uniref:bifunctional cobalt-precorrin-7 (C(5))-methyltransferase/cobalt-precorrin-6B (C(15))-methyltransferase n=1 Tax=Actinokineospora enzanensis TaxID=155975 RepID=UPI00037C05AB|nr:bifunctional cobalt-precorrin-7 (C(5))-methyltransferase CbiE/decarboxylating cobalt-precorrin-6B (C(15))-methyltransferase CbiT [Actinokineospora enzanensis]